MCLVASSFSRCCASCWDFEGLVWWSYGDVGAEGRVEEVRVHVVGPRQELLTQTIAVVQRQGQHTHGTRHTAGTQGEREGGVRGRERGRKAVGEGRRGLGPLKSVCRSLPPYKFAKPTLCEAVCHSHFSFGGPNT